jgi:hypothetical protein
MANVKSAEGLTQLFDERSLHFGEDHRVMDEVVGAYFGYLPAEFDDYFHEDMHVHLPNMIRLSWDDLTAMAGKVFPLYVMPDNDTPTAKNRAEHLEQIGYGYNEAGRKVGGISMQMLMKVAAWWQIGTANGVFLALPNYECKTPFFTFRDPRTAYFPIGWTPYSQAAPEDVLFAYQMTLGEIKRRYPDHAPELDSKLTKSRYGYGRDTAVDDYTTFWFGEYYHEDTWIAATLTEDVVTVARSDTGDKGHPDVMPAVPYGSYSPQGAKGRSMYADQLSIQAAMARMFSQKLDYYDRTLYQMIFHTPVSGNTIKMGPYATNEYVTTTGVQPRIDTIAPAHPIDADQMFQLTLGLSRMLNRNPEQFQGAGDADSAKALNELKSGITSTIRDNIWPPIIEALPKLYAKAAKIDVACWKYQRRYMMGSRKNQAFRTPYTPATDLFGREESFDVEPGLGLAGYQGTVEILQMLGAETISEDTALEQLEHVRDPQAEKRRIFNDRIQKVMFADLASKAQAGVLMPGAFAEIKTRAAKGEDPYEVMGQMEQAGRLIQPPPEMAAPPGAPADMLGPGVGGPGGPGPGAPTPSPEAVRRLAMLGRPPR